MNLKCPKCLYEWNTESKLVKVTCPSCNIKIPNPNSKGFKSKKEVDQKEQKKGSKSRIPNNLTEFNNPPNQICCVDLYESPVIKDIEREDKELYQNSF